MNTVCYRPRPAPRPRGPLDRLPTGPTDATRACAAHVCGQCGREGFTHTMPDGAWSDVHCPDGRKADRATADIVAPYLRQTLSARLLLEGSLAGRSAAVRDPEAWMSPRTRRLVRAINAPYGSATRYLYSDRAAVKMAPMPDPYKGSGLNADTVRKAKAAERLLCWYDRNWRLVQADKPFKTAYPLRGRALVNA